MSGTKEGGLEAARTNRAKYGDDFYSKIGAIGGSKGHTGGFYADKERARRAGRKGGEVSKKGHKFVREDDNYRYYRDLKTNHVVAFRYGL